MYGSVVPVSWFVFFIIYRVLKEKDIISHTDKAGQEVARIARQKNLSFHEFESVRLITAVS